MEHRREQLWHRTGFLTAALAASIFAVFSGVFLLGFLEYDDPFFVTLNTLNFTPITGEGLVALWGNIVLGSWTPIASFSHRLDVALYALNPAGHHATSLILHTGSTVLLFVLARRFHHVGPSLFIAASFGLHPTRLESVAWIAERRDVLMVFFSLLAVLLWTRTDVRTTIQGRITILVVGILACLSKQNAVVLPVLLLVVDILLLDRLRHDPWQRLVLEKAPLVMSALVVVVPALMSVSDESPLVSDTPGFRLQSTIITPIRYAATFLFPAELAFIYPRPSAWSPLMFGCSIIAMLFVSFLVWRGSAHVRFGVAWFLCALAPMSGIVFISHIHLIADRYLYLPSVGLSWTLVALFHTTASPKRRPWLPFVAAAWVGWLGWTTSTSTPRWNSAQSLSERALELGHASSRAHMFVGDSFALNAQSPNDLAVAISHYDAAVHLDPDPLVVRTKLAAVLLQVGRWSDACRMYENLSSTESMGASIEVGRGHCAERIGDDASARKHYHRATLIDPPRSEARLSYARFLASHGNRDGAIIEALAVINARKPTLRELFAAGSVLVRLERKDLAVAAWRVTTQEFPMAFDAWAALTWAACTDTDGDGGAGAHAHLRAMAAEEPLTHLLAVCVAFAQGRPEEAEQRASALLGRSPHYSEAIREMRREAGSDRREALKLLSFVLAHAGEPAGPLQPPPTDVRAPATGSPQDGGNSSR